MNDNELYKKFIKLIDEKKAEMINYISGKNSTHLELVKKDISLLQSYINGEIYLTKNDIDILLSNLVQYRITLHIPITNVYLARARKFEDSKIYPIYDDVSVLSYMPLHLKENAPLGRFNLKGESFYYGSLFNSYDDLNVPFSEIDVKDNDYVNLLISKSIDDINITIIGLFSLVAQDELFIDFHPIIKKINDYYNSSHEAGLLDAIKKVDDFFVAITNLDGNERVYNVTSNLGNIYMQSNDVDGIMYQSTKAKDVPNIVLKASSIDKKIKHLEAKISFAKYNNLNNYMDNHELNNGKVENCKIKWIKKP